MLPRTKAGFELDARLEHDTHPMMWLGLCELRLMDDARWPWLILIPQRSGIEEVHDLSPMDQALLTFESNQVAAALKRVTGCLKINSGALGNVVRQLHFHVVARDEGDANWPKPVWGHGEREPWRKEDRHAFTDKIKKALAGV
ncbi:MAG: HIT domain-containing protein [Brucellaceae bacterium]|nr:HIT domain-containing protein [Brucellaceae bacterium]